MQLLLTDLLRLEGIEVATYRDNGSALVLEVEARSVGVADFRDERISATPRGELEPSEGITSEQVKEALKGSKYALLKPEEHLTEQQKIKLEEIKSPSPLLATMHQGL